MRSERGKVMGSNLFHYAGEETDSESGLNFVNYDKNVIEYEMGRTCSTYGERRGAYRVLVGQPEGRRPLGRPRRRW
jgi:hypothetical protein